MGDEMTTKRELRADKIAVLAGLAANSTFVAMKDDARYAMYCDVMELVKDVHMDHQDDEPAPEPSPRQAFDWTIAVQSVIDSGESFRRDYPNKNTAQTTTSKLKKKYGDKPVRIHAIESETGGGTIVITNRLR